MPQIQVSVPLTYLNGNSGTAVATGNNAAWMCLCGVILLGRSGLARGVTDGFRIDCVCGKRYFVLPSGGNQTSVLQVEEVL